jgi:8-oxo-dGTP pyrophosphatase MutT (NUDIX family)
VRRVALRIAYRLLQLRWLLTRPSTRGVKCVVTDGDLVLLVRHTYGHRWWDLPGGGVKRNEAPATAARREMGEELSLHRDDWVELGEVQARIHSRRDTLHCFGVDLRAPEITIDRGELATAGWFPRADLPRPRAPYVAEIVALAPRRADAT